MPTKTKTPTPDSPADQPYRIDGRKFYWSPLDDNDERGTLPEVVIPLRIKLGLILDMDEAGGTLDARGMRDMLAALIPNQVDALREMDVNDFQEMFTSWQAAYVARTGATLGESSSSSS